MQERRQGAFRRPCAYALPSRKGKEMVKVSMTPNHPQSLKQLVVPNASRYGTQGYQLPSSTPYSTREQSLQGR